jgi:transcriptional regulator with XRE-family HTH domain
MITARQIRAARALLGWTQRELAEAAGLSLAVVNNIEREARDARASTFRKLQSTLEDAGIQLIEGPTTGSIGVVIAVR